MKTMISKATFYQKSKIIRACTERSRSMVETF